MRIRNTLAALLVALPLAASPRPGIRHAPDARRASKRPDGARKPLAGTITPIFVVNSALCGRITSRGTLYRTDVDITNLSFQDASRVFVSLIGFDAKTGALLSDPINLVLLADGSNPDNTVIPAYTNLHFDDFISILHDNGFVDDTTFADGFLGSLYVEFDGLPNNIGQASTATRFWSGPAEASVGAAAPGELVFLGSTDGSGFSGSAYGSQVLAGLIRDTRGEAGVPQLKPNLFVNNTGVGASSGSPTADGHDTIYIAAYDAYTGDPVGTTRTFDLAFGQTGVIGDVLNSLNVPLSTDQIVIYVSAIDGAEIIQAISDEIDGGSGDGSITNLTPVPPAV